MSARTNCQVASPNFRYLEVRILDDAYAVAKWIFDRSHFDAFAYFCYRLELCCTERKKARKLSFNICNPPPWLRTVGARCSIWKKAKLKAANGKANIVRLIEVRLDS
jgi:hypothetical protein